MIIAMKRAPDIFKAIALNLKKSGVYRSQQQLARAMDFKDASSIQRYLDPDSYTEKYFDLDIIAKIEKACLHKGAPPVTLDEVWSMARPRPESVLKKEDTLINESLDALLSLYSRSTPEVKKMFKVLITTEDSSDLRLKKNNG